MKKGLTASLFLLASFSAQLRAQDKKDNRIRVIVIFAHPDPVFLYMEDDFKKPNPITHDIVVGIDEVLDKKINGLHEHTSQMYEWSPWIDNGGEVDKSVPAPADTAARKAWLKMHYIDRIMSAGQRAGLEKWYGKEKAASFKFAESFEITEYGRQPGEADIRRLFPMLKK